MSNRGRVLLFTGDGKGKTTAALGMVLRAVGHNMRVLIIQFIKGDASIGELAACAGLRGVEVVQTGKGFVPKPDSPHFAEHCCGAEHGFHIAEEAIQSGNYDLIVLDEICNALAKNLVDENRISDLIKAVPANLSVVLTGRNAAQGLMDLADTVTEMRCVKHGYKVGIPAQKGVEF